MDEFQSLEISYNLNSLSPYKDFSPFKTALSYYFFKIPYFFSADQWFVSLFGRAQSLLVITAALIFSCINLNKFLRKEAILFSLVLLLSVTNMIEHTSVVRADPLVAASGLVSLIFLLKNRFFLAGSFVVISFLLSQKGMFFWFASMSFLSTFFKTDRKKCFKNILSFNVPFIFGLLFYILYFSNTSSVSVVLNSLIFIPLKVFSNMVYELRWIFFIQTFTRNPIFYLITLCFFTYCFFKRREIEEFDRKLFYYGITFLVCFLFYPQPWPYFFVILAPVFFVINARYIDMRFPKLLTKTTFMLVIFSLISSFPRVSRILSSTQDEQRVNISIANSLLDSGGKYFAGVAFLPHRKQFSNELSLLDKHQLFFINSFSQKRIESIVKRLHRQPPKVLIHNYRLYGLPIEIRKFFEFNYVHLCANIFLYSPRFKLENDVLILPFSAKFKLKSESEIMIDEQKWLPGTKLFLNKGKYRLKASVEYQLIQTADISLNNFEYHFKKVGELFPDVYN